MGQVWIEPEPVGPGGSGAGTSAPADPGVFEPGGVGPGGVAAAEFGASPASPVAAFAARAPVVEATRGPAARPLIELGWVFGWALAGFAQAGVWLWIGPTLARRGLPEERLIAADGAFVLAGALLAVLLAGAVLRWSGPWPWLRYLAGLGGLVLAQVVAWRAGEVLSSIRLTAAAALSLAPILASLMVAGGTLLRLLGRSEPA